jgi:hypothetical protein
MQGHNMTHMTHRQGTSQVVLGSSDGQKVTASQSLFLKSEKIPALLYKGKGPEYRPFSLYKHDPNKKNHIGSRDHN